MPDGNYVSVADIRNEGITEVQASNTVIEETIFSSEQIFESWTGRWFYRKAGYTLILDGGKLPNLVPYSGGFTHELLIPVPALTITEIEINGSVRPLTDFINYNRIGVPSDDRFNPKIISKNFEWPEYGLQNIKITGDFGFVEETTTYRPPIDVRRAVRKLTIRNLPFVLKMTEHDRFLFLEEGRTSEEATPGFKMRLNPRRARNESEPEGWTGDHEIDSVILRYRYAVGFSAS